MSGCGVSELKLKYVCRTVGGGTPDKENLDFWNGDIPWISAKDMGQFRISFAEDHITREAVAASATRIVPAGSVLVVARSGILRHTLPVGVTLRDFAINQDMKALIPDRSLQATFLAYFIKGNEERFLSEWRKTGTTVESIEQELMQNSLIRVPCASEQIAITKFLDERTCRIDDLIERKRRLIELLDEKRTSLISQVVTRGLDPNSPMKESGVDWLGRIPAHWTLTRTKFLFSYVTSGSRGWAEHYSESGQVFLRITNVTRDGIELSLDDLQRVSVPDGAEGERTRAQPGDLVISITAWVGAVGIVPEGLGQSYVSQHLALCRPKAGIHSRWLAYTLFALPMKSQFNQLMYGGTKVQLGLGDVKNILVPVPPPNEQQMIAQHIDELTGKYAEAQHSTTSAIDLLREYRSALITAAVTGQLDLRDHEKKMEAQP